METTWSLVVPTLNRRECLLRSLKVNTNQTSPPRQVIVIDSSDDWEVTRDLVFAELKPQNPNIEWIYLPAKKRSLTHQRNEGLEHCVSDVAFLLDDDSFMYSNCAEQILRVYELDANQSVAGVCATLACDTESDSSTSKIDALSPNIRQRLLDKFQRFWDQEQLFIPYDGKYHRKVAPHIPDSVAAPVGLFHGCRMTFRLKVLREVGGFEELLLRSAYCEDGDCSYRVSRKGTLLVARNAQIFHEQTTQERTKRRLNTLMILMNAIVLFELNKSPELRSNVVIYSFLAKRAALEFLRDSFKLRLQFPNLSAVFEAFTLTPKLIKLRSESLRDEYLKTQERLFAK